jgi:hypothetical protein
MTQLDSMWILEQNYILLEEYKLQLKILRSDEKLRELEAKYRKNEGNLLSLKTILERCRKELVYKEKKLKNSLFTFEELEHNLYDGSISDFKQLDHMSNEREDLHRQIKDLENEIIELMEKIDEIDSKIEISDSEMENLKGIIKKNRKINLTKERELNEKITEVNLKIDEYSNNIDPELLNKYIAIRRKKKNGIAKIVNNICTGCNTVISTYDLDKAKKSDEIICCELCGRILYYANEDVTIHS